MVDRICGKCAVLLGFFVQENVRENIFPIKWTNSPTNEGMELGEKYVHFILLFLPAQHCISNAHRRRRTLT